MTNQTVQSKARAVGINHVALEVGDIDKALEFYGRFLDFEVANRSDTAAFIYFGDQFINFSREEIRGRTRTGISALQSTTRRWRGAPSKR